MSGESGVRRKRSRELGGEGVVRKKGAGGEGKGRKGGREEGEEERRVSQSQIFVPIVPQVVLQWCVEC